MRISDWSSDVCSSDLVAPSPDDDQPADLKAQPLCPCCGGTMIIIEVFERRYLPRSPPSPAPSSGIQAPSPGTDYRQHHPGQTRPWKRTRLRWPCSKADVTPPNSARPLLPLRFFDPYPDAALPDTSASTETRQRRKECIGKCI